MKSLFSTIQLGIKQELIMQARTSRVLGGGPQHFSHTLLCDGGTGKLMIIAGSIRHFIAVLF